MELLTYHTSNIKEINQLFINTFTDSEGEPEGVIIGKLVNDYMTITDAKDFYCFVASEDKQIIASVFFTKMTFESDIKAYILSPMAVLTEHQRKGIGKKLINFGLNILKEDGVEVVITYGDPNYYSRVGFKHISEDIIKAPLKLSYPEGWLAQSLTGNKLEPIAGKPKCVDALNIPELW